MNFGRKKKFLAAAVLNVFLLVGILILISPLAQKSHAGFSLSPQTSPWEQVNTDGFGDANNWGEIHLAVFGGRIYAAVGNNNGVQIWRTADGTAWEAVVTGGLGDTNNVWGGDLEVFDGYLYVSTVKAESTTGAEVWRSASGDAGSWVQVNNDGFGDNDNRGIEAMAVFGGYLYAGTGYKTLSGAEVWRTADGTNWTQVNEDGFGLPTIKGIRSMAVFNGRIYVGAFDGLTGGKVVRSANGTDWEASEALGFGDDNNTDVVTLEVFNGYLYAGTINSVTGTELWRTSTGDVGSWTQVNSDGFGTAANIWSSFQGAVVNGIFLVGTRNELSGAELWYSLNGTDWKQEGGIGFGDPNNFALYAVTFKGSIYAAFSNMVTGAEIWRRNVSVLAIATESLPEGRVGDPYLVSLGTSSGTSPYSWSVLSGSLPPGLSLAEGGVLSGTPSESGTFTFTLQVVDSGRPQQSASQEFSLRISSVAAAAVTAPATELPETGSSAKQCFLHN